MTLRVRKQSSRGNDLLLFTAIMWDHTYVMGMKGHAGCPEVLSPTPSSPSERQCSGGRLN